MSVRSPSHSADSYGQKDPSFSEVSEWRAKIEPLAGNEVSADGTTKAAVTHEITMRYGSEIASLSPTWRIVFGVRNFEVVSVLNVIERGQWFVCSCREVVEGQ